MNTVTYILTAIVVLGMAYLLLRPLVSAYLKFRGTRVISCPETCKPAAVEVNARHAALTSIRGKQHLQLSDCSRWPERQDCGQECLSQIERSPEECLVRNILTSFYRGKNCVYCGKPIGQIDWLENKPALMSPEKITTLCSDMTPEMLPEALSTHLPVCFDCHVAESFRRLYPDIVVDRPWKGAPAQREK